jgi:hypothetical protein
MRPSQGGGATTYEMGHEMGRITVTWLKISIAVVLLGCPLPRLCTNDTGCEEHHECSVKILVAYTISQCPPQKSLKARTLR